MMNLTKHKKIAQVYIAFGSILNYCQNRTDADSVHFSGGYEEFTIRVYAENKYKPYLEIKIMPSPVEFPSCIWLKLGSVGWICCNSNDCYDHTIECINNFLGNN